MRRMTLPMPNLPLSAALEALATDRLERLSALASAQGLSPPDDDSRRALRQVLAVSDFAFETLRQYIELLAEPFLRFANGAIGDSAARWLEPWPAASDEEAIRALRRFRRAESLRLIARDVLGLDRVEDTLAGASHLAERCLDAALRHVEAGFATRFGLPRAASDGAAQRLVVIGMGKLGGGELNFSSDIDLIFAFPEAGATDGARVLDNEDYFSRLGQRLIQLLAEVTADGFAYRVDMRLRPFGSAGRLALSFAAMEHYYQRDGRDWERYAWIKARPVAGDLVAGRELCEQLTPFIYRRYLDYTAIDGLREMKALIDAEVSRRELSEHLKLGPGGIRELEFLVQLVQLVRGGRERALRTPAFRAALQAAIAGGHISADEGAELLAAYDFLRRLENRVQMTRDEQTHVLPEAEADRERLAQGLGFATSAALLETLDAHRRVVARAFAQTLHSERDDAVPTGTTDWSKFWTAISADVATSLPAPFGARASEALQHFLRSPGFRGLESRARARLDRVMSQCLARLATTANADETLARLLALLAAILGRPTYLALLDEQLAARERLLEVLGRSAWLAERVTAHPILLDDLLDRRAQRALPDLAAMREALQSALEAVPLDDIEESLNRIVEVKQSALFRLALAWLSREVPADELARRLANVADAMLERVFALAIADTRQQWGRLPGNEPGIAVLAYGSLGGLELGFGSDLDLVFVTDATRAAAMSEGARAVEGSRWYARVAQRLMHWLSTPVAGGTLYPVDTRLRPDGAKGLLVTTLESFADYQRERAWVWEHQALVRAQPLDGDQALLQGAARARREVLMTPREPSALTHSVLDMRGRWRAQLDRSDAARFDLKQGLGGLVDLEFTLQHLVLAHARRFDALTSSTRTRELIAIASHVGLLDAAMARGLAEAHEYMLGLALDATLDRAPRVAAREATLEAHREQVLLAARATGLNFAV